MANSKVVSTTAQRPRAMRESNAATRAASGPA